MIKRISLICAAIFLSGQASAADWKSEANMGAQGVQGAFANNFQDGMFDLQFGCLARAGQNRSVFMTLKTLPDAPIEPGNETEFPVTMLYKFSDGSTSSSEISVKWARDDRGTNVWNSSFRMDKAFLRNFSKSKTLQLLTSGGDVIFTYSMGGSAKAAQTLVKYCYSGNYS